LVRLGGIALSLSMAGIIGWILWQSPINFPDLWGGDFGRLISNNILLVAFCVLVLLQGIASVRSSAEARDRYNRRRAALQGDLDAIPVARITVHAENAPDVVESPLVLQWAASKATRWVIAPLEVFLCVVCFALPLLEGGAFVYALRNGNLASRELGLLSFLMPVAVLLACVVMFPLVGVILLIRDMPRDFGRPFGLSVGPEGILGVRSNGRRRFLRWEEMRLLEVTANSAHVSRTFRLYGPSTSIEWSLFSAGATYVPNGISAAEMETRSRSLLDLINARTGLVPRTFDKPRRQLSGKMGTVEAIGCIAALVLTTIGFVAGLIFIPVTSSHLLNLSLVATVIYIFIVFIVLVGAVSMSALQKPVSSEESDNPQQLPDDVSVSYTLTFGSTVMSRIFSALSGIVICVDLVPAVLWLIAVLPLPVGGLYPHIVGAFGHVASLVLLPVGLFGLGMIIWALVTRITSVTADTIGLTARRGRRTTFIAWNDVERVSGEDVGGRITTYKVQGAFMTISWAGGNSRPTQARNSTGLLPISPYGLANLVAVRTGKPLSITKRADLLGDYQDAIS
ncbi:MAG: hypothetical protein ACXWPI_12435, partial [Ktedonobacterales bacterium]